MKQLFMGNEAIARGAVEAGIGLAAAYPGTPSSEVFTSLMEWAPAHGYYVEYSVNEKVALEVAAGASYAGVRAIVSMKQVGLNVAADPLMTLAYIGIKGGLVLVVADDPGPHSSQNEQDTRRFGRFAKLPVFDPATPQEAKEMTIAAFELSEQLALPVIIRPTTRTCHVCQDVTLGPDPQHRQPAGFQRDPKWVIMPRLAYQKHQELERKQAQMADLLAALPFNRFEKRGPRGVITSGVSYNYVMEALQNLGREDISVFKCAAYPVSDRMLADFLAPLSEVLAVEELEPVLEDAAIHVLWAQGLKPRLLGKYSGHVPREGELDTDKVERILAGFLDLPQPVRTANPPPPLPARQPTLCAGCPHRASFFAFKEAAKGRDALFTGDIGCYTLGNAKPLEMVDTCLCMGAGVTMAQGLKRAEPGRRVTAFIGDSTFFHTGIPGLINAVYNQTPITLAILDNRTTAMTGFQPHPGLPQTAMGPREGQVDIAALVRACGVQYLYQADPCDLAKAIDVAGKALDAPGPAVVIMTRECAAQVRPSRRFQVDPDACINCGICYGSLGCPALSLQGETVKISDTCSGCALCSQICPVQAIEEVSR